MATPKKNKSGTWSIRVYSHTDEQKRPHQKLLTAPSKAEIRALIEAAEVSAQVNAFFDGL